MRLETLPSYEEGEEKKRTVCVLASAHVCRWVFQSGTGAAVAAQKTLMWLLSQQQHCHGGSKRRRI